jgi:murein DD-endopeptidase MepM/ murein hydrolase activator NlpD
MDPSRIFSELSECRNRVVAELRERGFDCLIHYASVEILQDTYGIEVRGIREEENALSIVEVLVRLFPEWRSWWTRYNDDGCDPGFVAWIQRDPEPPARQWEPAEARDAKFVDEHIYELPYDDGEAFQVMQGYGGSVSHRGGSFYALDFSMPTNTRVCAARSGVVTSIDSRRVRGGNEYHVEISHDDGTAAEYCHLTTVAVRLDHRVAVSECVGWSGSPGWGGCPHLHFHVTWLCERIPTKFRAVEGAAMYLEEGEWYTKPYQLAKTWRARIQLLKAKLRNFLPTRRKKGQNDLS